jgi:hypothetical protein
MLTLDDDSVGEIHFEIGTWDEKELAERLSMLVWGLKSEGIPYQKGGGSDSWDLGGNDWFLLVEGEGKNRIARLNHRYGGAFPLEYWKSLRLVIEYALHGCGYTRGNFTKYGRREAI